MQVQLRCFQIFRHVRHLKNVSSSDQASLFLISVTEMSRCFGQFRRKDAVSSENTSLSFHFHLLSHFDFFFSLIFVLKFEILKF